MNENYTTIIISVLTALFGAGGWKFYQSLIINKREKEKEKKSEQTIFRDDLILRVKKLETDKEECMASLMNISNKLASLETKVEFLEKDNKELLIRINYGK
jgi:predicted negative regulator of RcsB-dependent stress response